MLIFILIQILIDFSVGKQWRRSVASDLGMHCLPLSDEKDARFIRVKTM